jgi:hypothetical protein
MRNLVESRGVLFKPPTRIPAVLLSGGSTPPYSRSALAALGASSIRSLVSSSSQHEVLSSRATRPNILQASGGSTHA